MQLMIHYINYCSLVFLLCKGNTKKIQWFGKLLSKLDRMQDWIWRSVWRVLDWLVYECQLQFELESFFVICKLMVKQLDINSLQFSLSLNHIIYHKLYTCTIVHVIESDNRDNLNLMSSTFFLFIHSLKSI